MLGLPLPSGVIKVILVSSEITPSFGLSFIAIERGVFSISAENLTNLSIIFSIDVAF